jgi:hypothetical protein
MEASPAQAGASHAQQTQWIQATLEHVAKAVAVCNRQAWKQLQANALVTTDGKVILQACHGTPLLQLVLFLCSKPQALLCIHTERSTLGPIRQCTDSSLLIAASPKMTPPCSSPLPAAERTTATTPSAPVHCCFVGLLCRLIHNINQQETSKQVAP